MKRLFLVALALGLGAAFVVPQLADASHITEPVAPISGLRLDVYNYVLGPGSLKCDGTQTVTWDYVRIEPLVAGPWDGNRAPSEHWTTLVQVFRGPVGVPIPVANPRSGRGVVGEWNAEWRHQNVPPHPRQDSFWEASEANHIFNGQAGMFLVKVTVRGDVSGRSLVAHCMFGRANP